MTSLVELCAEARRVHPTLAIDDVALTAAIVARAGGDLDRYLASCHAADLALALAAATSSEAMAELERVHAATIKFAVRRFVGPGHTTDDLHQLLREKLFVGDRPAIAEYDGRGSLASWLRVIAVRLFIDLTRRKDRVREAPLASGAPEPVEPRDLALDAIKAEYRQAVAEALAAAAAQLPAGDRHLLRQHFVAGLSIDQLGAALGIHRATAARRLARAKQQLADLTRERVVARLQLADAELAEVLGLVISRLDVSMRTLLR